MNTVRTTPTSTTAYTTSAGSPQRVQGSEGTQTGTQGQQGQQPDAFGHDNAQATSPQSYKMENGEWHCPPGTAQPAENLKILDDFGDDDETSAYFDPGAQALNKLVEQKQEANFEAGQAEVESVAEQEGGHPEVTGPSSSAQATPNSDLRGLNTDDPQIQELIAKIRDTEDKNIKALLDMVQQSLDKARKMLEDSNKDYYTRKLPQQEAMKKAADTREAALAQLRELGNVAAQMQAVVAQDPAQNSPAVRNAIALLSVAQQASSRAH